MHWFNYVIFMLFVLLIGAAAKTYERVAENGKIIRKVQNHMFHNVRPTAGRPAASHRIADQFEFLQNHFGREGQ